jgi:hypothetical protein
VHVFAHSWWFMVLIFCVEASFGVAGGVWGLALHPSRKYAVSVSADASWAWWDLAEATRLQQVGNMGTTPHCNSTAMGRACV